MDTRNRSVLQLGLACLALSGRSRTSHQTSRHPALGAKGSPFRRRKATAFVATESLATAALTVVARGHGGLSRALLGSTAHEALRQAECDVLLVPDAAFDAPPAVDENPDPPLAA